MFNDTSLRTETLTFSKKMAKLLRSYPYFSENGFKKVRLFSEFDLTQISVSPCTYLNIYVYGIYINIRKIKSVY